MTATALTGRRELAYRANDGIEVTLFWSKAQNTVSLEVIDTRSGVILGLDVDHHAALEAFHHPYAYAAGRQV